MELKMIRYGMFAGTPAVYMEGREFDELVEEERLNHFGEGLQKSFLEVPGYPPRLWVDGVPNNPENFLIIAMLLEKLGVSILLEVSPQNIPMITLPNVMIQVARAAGESLEGFTIEGRNVVSFVQFGFDGSFPDIPKTIAAFSYTNINMALDSANHLERVKKATRPWIIQGVL